MIWPAIELVDQGLIRFEFWAVRFVDMHDRIYLIIGLSLDQSDVKMARIQDH